MRTSIPGPAATETYIKQRREERATKLRICRFLWALYTGKMIEAIINSLFPELKERYRILALLGVTVLRILDYITNLLAILLLLREVVVRMKRSFNQGYRGHWSQQRTFPVWLAVLVTLVALVCGGPTGILTPPMCVICYFLVGEPNALVELWDGGLGEALKHLSIGNLCLSAMLHFLTRYIWE